MLVKGATGVPNPLSFQDQPQTSHISAGLLLTNSHVPSWGFPSVNVRVTLYVLLNFLSSLHTAWSSIQPPPPPPPIFTTPPPPPPPFVLHLTITKIRYFFLLSLAEQAVPALSKPCCWDLWARTFLYNKYPYIKTAFNSYDKAMFFQIDQLKQLK